MKLPRSRFMRKILLFSLLLGAFPVITLGVFSYQNSASAIQEKVWQGNKQLLLQTQLQVENMLKTTDRSVLQFINSYLVKMAMDRNLTFRDFEMIRDLSNALISLQTIDLPIQDIYLVNLDKNWVINNMGLAPISESEEKEKFLKYAELPYPSSWVSEGPSRMSLVKKIPQNYSKPAGLLIVQLPGDQLNRLLSKGTDTGDIMILTADYHVIATGDPNISGQDISFMPYISELKKNYAGSGYFQVNMHHNTYGIDYSKSLYNGWIYLSAVSNKQITLDIRMIGWVTLMICFAIFIVTLGLSLFAGKRMYSPIRKLYESVIGAAKRDDQPTGVDELHFIDEQLHLLLDTQSQLKIQIKGQMQQLNDFFIQKLVRGQIASKDIAEQLKLFGYPSFWKQLCLIIIQIDHLKGTRYEAKDRDILMFTINNIVCKLISDHARFLPVLIDQSQVTLFCGNAGNDKEFLNQMNVYAEKIQDNVKQYLNLNISIGISRVYSDLTKTPNAFQEGLEALKYRIVLGEGTISSYGDVQSNDRLLSTFPENTEKELIQSIKQVDSVKTKECLDHFFESIVHSNIDYREYQIFLVQLLLDLLHEMRKAKESAADLLKDEKTVFEQLFEINSAEEAKAWFKTKIIEPLMETIKVNNDSKFKQISSKMKDMIHKEFDKGITLESCAASMNYHPNYLKRVFRQETGINFSDYLSDYRLKMAKQWLNETDMKIMEISERLSYSNVQNFSRYFRKMEGVSPLQYRERCIFEE